MTDDPSTFFQDIRKELDALKAENDSLKKEVTELKQKSTVEIDSELMEALAEFDQDLVINGNQEEAKKELLALLDDLEEMIESLNAGSGMGLNVPNKLHEIRNSLTT